MKVTILLLVCLSLVFIISCLAQNPSITPSPGSPATYSVTFDEFASYEVYDTATLVASLKEALSYTQITETSPFAKRDLGSATTVYVENVLRGSAFQALLIDPNNWIAEFNNVSNSNVTASQVSVVEIFASTSPSTSASSSTSFIPSTSPSMTASPSPLANINLAVTFPDLVTNVINDTEELEMIFAETLNITDDRVTAINPAPGQRRNVPSQTVYVTDNSPAFAAFVSDPNNWIVRFNDLAGIDSPIGAADVTVRQLTSVTPSISASTGLTPTATPSTSLLVSATSGLTPSASPAAGACPFNFPFNSSTGFCVLPGQTLYLPFDGPIAGERLPGAITNSLTVCVTVNSPDCMINPPITGKRQGTVMNSTCSQPFSRFWAQWDACVYDNAAYANANQSTFDPSNTDFTCSLNNTQTQITYLGAYYGNWSFSQQPCYNSILTAKRQAPSEQCFCVPYPDVDDFGVIGFRRFYTELTVFQTEDSGVPASVRIICNDFPCYNQTNSNDTFPGPLPLDYVRYESSNDRALVLGIVLGFGLPCLIYCIAAIIIAILILLLLLLLGKSTTAKTFWVPSRDDL